MLCLGLPGNVGGFRCHTEGEVGSTVILREGWGSAIILRERWGSAVILRERWSSVVCVCHVAPRKDSAEGWLHVVSSCRVSTETQG